MAVTRVSGSGPMTTGGETIYTCTGTGKTAEVIHFQVSNIDGSVAADATVSWTDDSDTDYETFLCEDAEVAAGDAIAPIAGVLILNEGDTLKTSASANGDLQYSYSIIERG